jgi:triphosphatase
LNALRISPTSANTKKESRLSEIELKLSASHEHIPQLRQALESMEINSPPASSTLSSVYYDSAELKLRQRELGFRIREEQGRYVQTLKSGGIANGDLLSRSEWEDVIVGDRPDFAAPQTGPRLNDVIIASELRPLFKTIVQRTSIGLEPRSSTRIEAAIDEGEIRSTEGDASEPVCEIELELKDGDAAAIYDVALRLLDVAPLRIETRSKSERGYRLVAANGESTTAVHATPVALEDSMSVEAALHRIGRSCINHLLRNEPATLSGQAEGVHQMRVAARRLRAALSALKSMLPAEHYRWTLEELRWLAGMLGPVRNWDVFAASLLRPMERSPMVQADLKRLAEVAEQRRQVAYEGLKEAIRSQRYTATMLRLARWFEARGWREQPASEHAALLFTAIGDIAPGLIERRWRRTRKHSRQFGKLSPERRHKLRITLKKLRYTIEFLENLFDHREVKAMVKRLKPLQEDLGQLNDLSTARALVEEVSRHVNEGGSEISRAGGIVLGWHDRGLTDREPKLRKEIRRLRRARPFWPRTDLPLRVQVGASQTQGRNTAGDQSAGGSTMNGPETAHRTA